MVSHVWILPATHAAALQRDENREMEDLSIRRNMFAQGLILSILAAIRIAVSALFPSLVQHTASWNTLPALHIGIAVAGNCITVLCIAAHPLICAHCIDAKNYYLRAKKQVDNWLVGFSGSNTTPSVVILMK